MFITNKQELKHMKKVITSLILGAILSTSLTGVSQANATDPFGGDADVTFAKKLWATLKAQKLVGPDRINVQPFKGNEPHGAIQQVLGTTITIDGRTAKAIVKANHGGKDISVGSVYSHPNKNLGAYTVMFKREEGYDTKNQNWFWAKYTPTGELAKTPKKANIAGRFPGCIGCHTGAGGSDMETLTQE